ncbi:MAG TPA: trypsin-like peptidase domain-containing protein, partial [Lacipirellulaceae bacterium]|nr:trypsin-like peptidase domain-containing protein [Lacipirellulaceae bacterium]
RPPIEPVKLASHAPRPGDLLTIHGYGQGQYRVATGRCTAYYAPRLDYPQEMLELDVEARQGDSGGPIFNDRGELAGVLFGAGQGTTLGSFAPRVSNFLATLAPDIGQSDDAAPIAMADRPAPNVRQPDNGWVTPVANYPSSPWSPPAPVARNTSDSPTTSSEPVQVVSTATVPQATSVPLAWNDVANAGWYEPLKSALAVVGLLAIVGRLVKAVR